MIIFLDANFDDIITLLMLVKNKIHIDCIVVTAGWCNLGIGIANIIDILHWIGVDIPVFPGSPTTPNQESVNLESLYYIDTLWNTMKYVPRSKECLPLLNNDYIEFCKKIDSPVDILVLVSFTDVVPLLDSITIKKVYSLGMSPDVRVTADPLSDIKHSLSESNIYLDPKAALETLEKIGNKIVWIPSPFIATIPVDKRLLNELKKKYKKNRSKINLFVYKLINHMVKIGYTNNIFVWDAVIALLMLFPKCFKIEQESLSIDDRMSRSITRSENEVVIIETYSRRLGLRTEGKYITNVVTGMNSDKIYSKFIDIF